LVVIGLYGYIYWRSFAPPIYNECTINGDFRKFIGYITAQDYKTYWGRQTSSVNDLWNLFVKLGIKTLTKPGWFLMWAGMIAAFIRDTKRTIPVLLGPAGLVLIAWAFRDHEPESWLSPFYPFSALLLVSLPVLLAELAGRILKTEAGKSRSGSRAETAVIAIAAILLAFGVGLNLKHNYRECDLSGPSQPVARAERILKAIQTPAVIMTPGYHENQWILYGLLSDDKRHIKAFPWGSANTPDVPIAVSDPWKPDSAKAALANGSHVYIFMESAGEVGNQFTLTPVSTGVSPPELFEIKPRQSAVPGIP
jgi:hypothetical protein